jgi:hypothetical protein
VWPRVILFRLHHNRNCGGKASKMALSSFMKHPPELAVFSMRRKEMVSTPPSLAPLALLCDPPACLDPSDPSPSLPTPCCSVQLSLKATHLPSSSGPSQQPPPSPRASVQANLPIPIIPSLPPANPALRRLPSSLSPTRRVLLLADESLT